MVDLPRLAAIASDGFKRPAHHARLPNIATSFPNDSSGDVRRSRALGLRCRCSMCGCAMRDRFYNVFYYSPEDDTGQGGAHPGGFFTSQIPGPMHRACALYSVLVCPFLHYASSRTHNQTPKCRRGDASIVGFQQYGVAYFGSGVSFHRWTDIAPQTMWAYANRCEHIQYGSFKEVLPLYDEAVAADARSIDVTTRLHWSGSPAHSLHLSQCAQQDQALLANLRSGAFTPQGCEFRVSLLYGK